MDLNEVCEVRRRVRPRGEDAVRLAGARRAFVFAA
jgi:hypothetical protein